MPPACPRPAGPSRLPRERRAPSASATAAAQTAPAQTSAPSRCPTARSHADPPGRDRIQPHAIPPIHSGNRNAVNPIHCSSRSLMIGAERPDPIANSRRATAGSTEVFQRGIGGVISGQRARKRAAKPAPAPPPETCSAGGCASARGLSEWASSWGTPPLRFAAASLLAIGAVRAEQRIPEQTSIIPAARRISGKTARGNLGHYPGIKMDAALNLPVGCSLFLGKIKDPGPRTTDSLHSRGFTPPARIHFPVNHLADLEPAFDRSCICCRFSQNSGLLPKKRARRRAVSGVIPRLPRRMSPIRVAGTRILMARAFAVIPSGPRNSSRNISPGCVVIRRRFHPDSGLLIVMCAFISGGRSAVIVGDLHVMRSICLPNKADAVLVIDPYAVLGRTITLEGLKPVSQGNPEISQARRCLQLIELAKSYRRNRSPAPIRSSLEQLMRVCIFEALDHTGSI